jgi:hypothetical protein
MSTSLECWHWRANLSIRGFERDLPLRASVGFDSASARQPKTRYVLHRDKRMQR